VTVMPRHRHVESCLQEITNKQHHERMLVHFSFTSIPCSLRHQKKIPRLVTHQQIIPRSQPKPVLPAPIHLITYLNCEQCPEAFPICFLTIVSDLMLSHTIHQAHQPPYIPKSSRYSSLLIPQCFQPPTSSSLHDS